MPEAIDDQMAAVLLLQGLTVEYLVTDSHAARAGETVLIHAASVVSVVFWSRWPRPGAPELFAAVLVGSLEQRVAKTYALGDGATADRCLEDGQLTGKLLLIP